MNNAQHDKLLEPLQGFRAKTKQGVYGTYLEAWDVIAQLNHIFGFNGWCKEVKELVCVSSVEKGGKYTVIYRATVQLTVRFEDGTIKISEDSATCDGTNQVTLADAHDLAVKGAVSQALKRCAKDLGDQFGLSLYNEGSLDPVVGSTLV